MASETSTKGDRTRARVFEAAVRRFRTDGYAGASLRAIAADAEVTPGLVYRYFDGKEALVGELYRQRLSDWVARAAALPRGTWAQRTAWLTRLALDVLAEDRLVLRALAPGMLEGDEVLSPLRNRDSVAASRAVFRSAVEGATNAPRAQGREATAELAYLLHLALLLYWTMDRSAEQRATRSVLAQAERLAPLVELALRTPVLGRSLAALVRAITVGLDRGSDV